MEGQIYGVQSNEKDSGVGRYLGGIGDRGGLEGVRGRGGVGRQGEGGGLVSCEEVGLVRRPGRVRVKGEGQVRGRVTQGFAENVAAGARREEIRHLDKTLDLTFLN